MLCVVEQAGTAEVELAVAAAREGFVFWSAMTGAERGRILQRAVQLLRARNREMYAVQR
ncbi:MAG: aldehyde dehydrogenase family protein [Casimicrobiaceae bacterium]